MFEGMAEYINGICEEVSKGPDTPGTPVQDGGMQEEVGAVGGDVDEHSSTQHPINPGLTTLYNVDLVSLLTNVTGYVRERSKFTQYMNYSYRDDKYSEPLCVDITHCPLG